MGEAQARQTMSASGPQAARPSRARGRPPRAKRYVSDGQIVFPLRADFATTNAFGMWAGAAAGADAAPGEAKCHYTWPSLHMAFFDFYQKRPVAEE
jgi:hypothetical protein